MRHTKEAVPRIEEVVCLTRLHREYIVVEVEVLLIKPLDTMQMHLYRVAIEGWEILRRDNILVEYDVYLVTIHPLGDLTLVRHYEVDLADKWHILSYTAKEIAQCSPITKALLQHRLGSVLLIVALPYGVQSVYVCDNYIHPFTVFAKPFTSLQSYNFIFNFAKFAPQYSLAPRITLAYTSIKKYNLRIRKSLLNFAITKNRK